MISDGKCPRRGFSCGEEALTVRIAAVIKRMGTPSAARIDEPFNGW
jgi:hypothetical protein